MKKFLMLITMMVSIASWGQTPATQTRPTEPVPSGTLPPPNPPDPLYPPSNSNTGLGNVSPIPAKKKKKRAPKKALKDPGILKEEAGDERSARPSGTAPDVDAPAIPQPGTTPPTSGN